MTTLFFCTEMEKFELVVDVLQPGRKERKSQAWGRIAGTGDMVTFMVGLG